MRPSFRADLGRMRRLIGYMRPYRGRLIVGMLAGAAFGVISGAFPKGVEFVFSRLFEGGEKPGFETVLLTALAIPCYFLVRGMLSFVNSYYMNWVSSRMLRDIRIELYEHLQSMSLDFFVRRRVSKLIQRVHNNTSMIQNSLVVLVGDLVKQPVTIIAAVTVLAYIDLWFSVFALILGMLCWIPMRHFGRKVRFGQPREDQSDGALLGLLHESFSNVRVVKAYLLERIFRVRFHQATHRQMTRSMYFKRQREAIAPLIELIGSLGIAVALIYVYASDIPTSEFLAVVAGFLMLYDPLKRLGRWYVQAQRVLTVSERVFQVMDTEQDPVERSSGLEIAGFLDSIRFEGVHLTYDDRSEALTDINLTIPQGTVCALIGPSGAGKSSLISLLARFYEPTAGRVLIDGRDLSEMSVQSVRRLIGLVTQETFLFADTVANNIACGKPEASREEIIEAAKRAHAHEFLVNLPKQYDTVLSDRGQNLSGGQAQRIAIARAFLKNPTILVLDEATSALDAESELHVREAMTDLMRGRTVIVIAHRLSTVRNADQFVVMQQGEIVEIGQHDELVSRDGLYRRLHDLQVV